MAPDYRGMRRPLLTVVAVLVAAGLSGCATAAGSTAATAPGSVASPGPVTRGKATPAPPTSAAPAVANTGTGWPAIVTSLTGYGQWLLANPNPALVGTIASPGCGTYNNLAAELQSLVDQGAYVKTTAPVFISLTGLSTTASNRATVDIQVSRAAEPLLDRKNAKTTLVLSTLPQLPPTAMQVMLIRGADNRWRFCDIIAQLDDPDGEASTTLF